MNDLFSERYNYVKKTIQYETLDRRTRNHLWDVVKRHFLTVAEKWYNQEEADTAAEAEAGYKQAFLFYADIYIDYFGASEESIPSVPTDVKSALKGIILELEWYRCFDVIEALIRLSPTLFRMEKSRLPRLTKFTEAINSVFIEERCSYTLMGGLIIPNTNDVEVTAIATALSDTTTIEMVNAHLVQAIRHYASRDNPDLRNALKESISALESLLTIIASLPTGTMKDALKLIKDKKILDLHPALYESMNKLYAWAGDESGIRHKLKQNAELTDIDDAKFIIVTCCNAVTFLIAKVKKAGIDLQLQSGS